MPLNILLTGSSGRIGRAIRAELAEACRVTGIDRLPGPSTDVVIDLRDTARLVPWLRGMDAVVHCAALHAPHVGVVADDDFIEINVAATWRLAEAARLAGVRRLVYTSTTALYGDASTPPDAAGWVDEDLPPQPRTIYHRSKLAAEQALAEVCAPAGMALTCLRMSRCFPEPAPQMALYRLHRGIDARDVASAHAAALRLDATGVRTYVISAATPFLREDLAALRGDAPGVLAQRAPSLVAAFAARGWALPRSIDRIYSPARALAALGWRPLHGFESVLRAFDEGSPEVLAPGG
jgi:UDP-glucose 4-epimerase